MTDVTSVKTGPARYTARALIVGERIDTTGLERPDTISLLPLAFRVGEQGMVALFRFGVAVMVGLTPLEEDDLLQKLKWRVSGEKVRGDDETAVLEISPEGDGQKASGGPIQIKDLSPDRFLVVADALAKTAALTRDEREVNAVFDVIEPFASKLASTRQAALSAQGHAQADRPGAAGAASRLRPRGGRGEAGRPVGPAGPRAALRAPRRRI